MMSNNLLLYKIIPNENQLNNFKNLIDKNIDLYKCQWLLNIYKNIFIINYKFNKYKKYLSF